MTPELLSRLPFAPTASFHFIFPPISMGLAVLLVWMGWRSLPIIAVIGTAFVLLSTTCSGAG